MKIIPLVSVLTDPGTAKVLRRMRTAACLVCDSQALQDEAKEHYQVLGKALKGREFTTAAMLVALWTMVLEVVAQAEEEIVEELKVAQMPAN
jgi:hypothetical protein